MEGPIDTISNGKRTTEYKLCCYVWDIPEVCKPDQDLQTQNEVHSKLSFCELKS